MPRCKIKPKPWTLPEIFRREVPEAKRNTYIPLSDFIPFPYSVPENRAFGAFFAKLLADRGAPVREVTSFMHMPPERILHFVLGTMPAPNREQLTVFAALLSLDFSDFQELLLLASDSWTASGLNREEQIDPPRTIFNLPEEPPAPVVRHDKKSPRPDFRMQVQVDVEELEDGTLIREVTTGAGDRIGIDRTLPAERDAASGAVHYLCAHGKHRIDLFREEDTWYMDATSLASGPSDYGNYGRAL